MSEKTPEERARRAFNGSDFCCLDRSPQSGVLCCHDTVDPSRHDDLCEYHSCLLEIRAAVAVRDVEWCKMLGFPEAGDVGNTPGFIRRELDSIIENDPDVALAAAAERERLLKWARFRRIDPRSINEFSRGYNCGLDDMETAIRKEPS